MKVLIVSGIWPPDIGGPASHGPSVGAFLTARGHEVRALISSEGPPPGAVGFPVLAVDRGAALPRRLGAGARALLRAVEWADVVYATGIYARTALAVRRRGVPLVLKLVNDPAYERARSRGYFAGSLEDFQGAGRHAGILALKALRRATLTVPARIVVPSRYLARFLTGWGVPAARVVVIPNPAPDEFVGAGDGRAALRRSLGVDGPIAVFAGRFVPQKDLPLLLEAFSDVPTGRLVLVGDGPEHAPAVALAERLRLGDRVRFVGAVDRAEATRWLRAADVMALSSAWENFPHAAVEALACGTPVVATSVGGVPEIVRDGVDGALVPPGDRAALAGALSRLLEDPAALEPMRVAAADGARRFEESDTFARLEAVLAGAARRRDVL